MKEINVFANWDYVWVDMTPEERIEIRKYVHSINENLTDEVIVTVIATGFEEPSEPLYHSFNSTKREDMYKDDDDYDDNDLDIPPFIRDRQDF